MSLFRTPRSIGGDLLAFGDFELNSLLTKQICGRVDTDCESEECDGCYGLTMLGHLENQIAALGILYMKQLVKDWRA